MFLTTKLPSRFYNTFHITKLDLHCEKFPVTRNLFNSFIARIYYVNLGRANVGNRRTARIKRLSFFSSLKLYYFISPRTGGGGKKRGNFPAGKRGRRVAELLAALCRKLPVLRPYPARIFPPLEKSAISRQK